MSNGPAARWNAQRICIGKDGEMQADRGACALMMEMDSELSSP
jgi:hypothetical protein